MRTFSIALFVAIAAFSGGFVWSKFYYGMMPRFLVDQNPLESYGQWLGYLNLNRFNDHNVGPLTEEQLRQAVALRFMSQTENLTLIFSKLSTEQVASVKENIKYLGASTAIPIEYKSNVDALVDCISEANVGDDLSQCSLTYRGNLVTRKPPPFRQEGPPKSP